MINEALHEWASAPLRTCCLSAAGERRSGVDDPGGPSNTGGSSSSAPRKEFRISWFQRPVGSLTVEHMLFLVGGVLLGVSLVGLTGPHEPNATAYVASAVVGLSTLIIGQQAAARQGETSSED